KNVNHQNAEEQAQPTATTNEPVTQKTEENQEKAQPEATQPEEPTQEAEKATEPAATTEEAGADAPAEAKDEQPAEEQKPEPKKETAHDDFDWTVDKRNVSVYSDEEKDRYEKLYDNTFKDI